MTIAQTGATCQVSGLGKLYLGRAAINNVSFDIAAGEFLVILGPSGCGKTTTPRLIAGLETPDAGTVMIGDRAVSDPARGLFIRPEHRDIGMVSKPTRSGLI